MDDAIAPLLRGGLEQVIESVITAVSVEVPAYSRAEDVRIQHVLRQGVRVALERLMGLLGTTDEALGPAAAVYERIGEAEFRAGRPLQAVLAAYRVGALATWRGLSSLSTGAGVDAVTVARLAEACFAYIDEISATSAAGYARAQREDAGRREALRSQLVEAIIDPAAAGRIGPVAAQLGWSPPESVVVAVWTAEEQPDGILCSRTGDLTVAVLEDPDAVAVRRLQRLEPSLGTRQPLAEAVVSYTHARALQALRRSQAARIHGIALAADHLPDLLLAADPRLAEALIAAELAPLDGMDPQRRAVLVDTAASWLLNSGARAAVAQELHIHPQTVAYRMEGVRRVFSAGLATSEGRWRLLLALRCEQQTRTAP